MSVRVRFDDGQKFGFSNTLPHHRHVVPQRTAIDFRPTSMALGAHKAILESIGTRGTVMCGSRKYIG